ncbi:MAG TPA: HAD family hydrolase [Alphaproteobacteria bacterium]|nr:HAD family hydrolase [Alphaproteobacteria bacterium]
MRHDGADGAADDFRWTFAARIEALLARPGIKCLSLDFFDTLMFRSVPVPISVFPLVGRALEERGWLRRGGALRFAEARIAAERRARLAEPGREVTLDQIYRALPGRMFAHRDTAALAAVEREVEGGVLRLFQPMAELAAAARRLGKRVAIVSDTYFGRDDLRAFLERAGGPQVDAVFCSSDYGVGKAGGLFERAVEDLGLEPGEILHCGDNYQADVAGAARHGLVTELVPNGTSELWQTIGQELELLREDYLTLPSPTQGDAGFTAMRARSCLIEPAAEAEPYRRFGTTVLGPIFAGFAEWLGQRLEAEGCDAALCLMREGGFLDRLIAGAARDFRPRALAHLSRQVVRRATIVTADRDSLGRVAVYRSVPPVEDILADLGLERGDLLAAGWSPARIAATRAVEPVLDAVAAAPALCRKVEAKAALLRRAVVRHVLRQLDGAGAAVGADGPLRLGLVDLGWNASIQAALDTIFAIEGVPIETVGLYLATSPLGGGGSAGCDAHGYLAAEGRPAPVWRSLTQALEVIEQCCGADSGSTVDLLGDGAPLLGPDRVPPGQRRQIRAVQEGVLAFQRLWRRHGGALADPGDERLVNLLRGILLRSNRMPTPAEAALFEAWSHDDNLRGGRTEPLLGHLPPALAGFMSAPQMAELPPASSCWPQGLAACGAPEMLAAVRGLEAGLFRREMLEAPLHAQAALYWSAGDGFDDARSHGVPLLRNHLGRSFAHLRCEGADIRAVRFDPVSAGGLVKLCIVELLVRHPRQPAPVRIALPPERLACDHPTSGLQPLFDGYYACGDDPQIHLDLDRWGLAGADAVELMAGLVVVDMPPGLGSWLHVADPAAPSPLPDRLARPGLALACHLDRVEGAEAARGRIAAPAGATLSVEGWCQAEDGRAPLHSLLVLAPLDAPGPAWCVAAQPVARPDVAAARQAGGHHRIGFRARIALDRIPAGRYRLEARQIFVDDVGTAGLGELVVAPAGSPAAPLRQRLKRLLGRL